MQRTHAQPAVLAWRQTRRDFRAGELRLLIVAVMLAVAALTAVGFFADRLKAGLVRDAAQLLGGDAIVAADQPVPTEFVERALKQGLLITGTVSFPSMARAEDAQGGATRLVAVKAVRAGYPLRGRLTLADAPGSAANAATGVPEPGSVWVDAGVLASLQLSIGDPLLLGDARLHIANVIVLEPDRGAGFMSLSPRVMLNDADLAATGLIQQGSRVTYRLAVAAGNGQPGAGETVGAYVAWAEAQIKMRHLRGVRVESLESGRPEMRQTLDRAEKFLNLVALLAALLSAVAVGIAARDFAARHLDDCAMLRVLGQPQRTIAWAYTLEFALVGLVASALGVLLGYAVHHVFVALLAGLVEATLPAPSAWPALFGLGVGFTLLAGFGLPPVLQLSRVPPLRVIRRDTGGLKPASIAVLAAGALGFAALLLAASSDVKLGLIAVGGFAAAIVLFALLAWGAVSMLRRAVPSAFISARAPRWLVLATRQVSARPGFAVLQISARGVGLLALVLLVLLRTDLVSSWRQATPPDAPDRFIINIQPEQGEDFQRMLGQAGVKNFDWYPMIRGRLVSVNGHEVSAANYSEDRARRLVEREFNLSHAAQMPSHNQLAAGHWQSEEPDGISVEQGIAETLGLKLGDTLRFDIAGMPTEGRITSLRKVDWASMRVNFFVMFPHAEMPDLPASYIAALRAPGSGAQAAAFDNALSRAFPNITNVDVSASVAQVSPWVPVAGALAGALLALDAGWWGLREVLRRPVVETLRKAAE